MRRIGSFFLTIFVCFIIIVCLATSLDLVGLINLPESLSLKKYLPKSIGTLGAGEEVYYPDYDATGLSAENKIAQGTIETEVKERPVEVNEISKADQELINDVLDNVKDLENDKNINNTEINNNLEVIESEYNVTDNSFFYTQLDTYGKTFYSRLYENIDNLKTGTYSVDFGVTFNDLLHTPNGETILTNAFQLSINALLLDHPEIFYLDVTKMYMFTESTTTFAGTTYRISIGPDKNNSYLLPGFNSLQDVYIAEDNLKTQLYTITSRLKGSTYDKILQVHNYLVDNVEYDSSNSDLEVSHTLYGALINNLAVCDGYAKAFKYILDNIGISCVEICGDAQNSSGDIESHAWNDVLLNGKWYAIDVTWDDPIIIGGTGILTNELRYSYFLKGSDTFYKSHQEDGFVVENGEFKYPQISTVSYY